MTKVPVATVLIAGMVIGTSTAAAQGKQDEGFGRDIASLLAKLEAQCAHRRTMPPDPRDDCATKLNKLRSEAQIGSGQGGDASASSPQAAATGPGNGGGNGIGPGNGGGQGNGIGPGSGGGQGKGRR